MRTLFFDSNLVIRFIAISSICFLCTSLGCDSNDDDEEGNPLAQAEYQIPVGHYPMSDAGISIASNGNQVLVDYYSFDTQEYGLTRVDFTDPSSPALIDSIAFEGMGGIATLQWNGDSAYALQSYYLESETESGWITRVTEVSTGTDPMQVNRTWDENAYPYHMVQKDSTLYISTDLGIYVVDIETWTGELAFTFEEPGIPGFMSIWEDRLYLFGQSLGLATFDISTPASPIQIGFYPFELDFSPPIFSKNNIVALSIDGDFVLIDATDPENPILLESVDVEGYATRIVFREENAYIAAGDAGAYQADATDPEAPLVLANCQTDYYVNNVALTDDLLIVSGHENGLSACELIDN